MFDWERKCMVLNWQLICHSAIFWSCHIQRYIMSKNLNGNCSETFDPWVSHVFVHVFEISPFFFIVCVRCFFVPSKFDWVIYSYIVVALYSGFCCWNMSLCWFVVAKLFSMVWGMTGNNVHANLFMHSTNNFKFTQKFF